jgi:hypothetical protein
MDQLDAGARDVTLHATTAAAHRRRASRARGGFLRSVTSTQVEVNPGDGRVPAPLLERLAGSSPVRRAGPRVPAQGNRAVRSRRTKTTGQAAPSPACRKDHVRMGVVPVG